MKRFKVNKLMGILLSIALIISMLPGFVFATDGEAPYAEAPYADAVTADAPYAGAVTAEAAYGGESTDHLIIMQAAGAGKNADGAFSHSFVELYNPTGADVDLSGWSLQYAENGADWNMLALNGVIPSYTSYLIRANGGRTVNTRYEIYYADQNWQLLISNDSFKFALVDNLTLLDVYNPGADRGVVDLIGAYNTSASVDYGEGGAPLRDISKQKSARRKNFDDTDDNSYDFESIDYRASGVSNERLLKVRPRSLRDGAWDESTDLPLPEPPVEVSVGFSEPAGLYQQQFGLTLSLMSDAGDIPADYIVRYTLDGEDPSPDSEAYEDTLLMRDRTADDEVMVQKQYTTSLLAMHATYVRPDLGTVLKGTVVKAQVFDAAGNSVSDVVTNTYIVNQDIFTRYANLPIISIATPADYFFDLDTGIYVRGNYENSADYIFPDNRPEWDGTIWNWDQSWERPVNFEMFDPVAGYERVVSQGMGVRIHGGVSRNSAQKSLRFYARNGMVEDYPLHNGASSVDYDIFNGAAKDVNGKTLTGGFQRFVMRAHGNDISSALLRDPLTNVLAADFNNETLAYRPAVLFLNGEFWGLYELDERYDEYYFGQHYNTSKDNYDILENPSSIEMTDANGTKESRDYYLSVVAELDSIADMNTPEAYANVLKYVDEDSLIDYTIAKTFIGDNDWVNRTNYFKKRHGNNNEIWRYTAAPTPVRGQDGKYRFLLKDSDMAFLGGLGDNGGGEGSGAQGMAFDTISMLTEEYAPQKNHYFYYKLIQNDAFRRKFINRYMDLLNTYLSPGVMKSTLDRLAAQIKPLLPEQKNRWNYTLDTGAWENELNWIKTMMDARASKDPEVSGIYKGLDALAAGLYGAVNAERGTLMLTVGNNGGVFINGIAVDAGSPGWSGDYYAGFEQTVRAVADPGHKFSHYIVDGDANNPVTTASYTFEMPAAGRSVEAVFVPDDGSGAPAPLIINQAAAVNAVADGSADGALSHGFVEIYNPTDGPVDISGWSLQYMKNGDTNWQVLNLEGDASGAIPSRHSYLVRIKGEVPLNNANRLLLSNTVTDWPVQPYGFDQEWADISGFSNSSFMYALVANQDELPYGMPDKNDGVVDFVGAGNDIKADFQWGTYEVIKMSKQQSVRRSGFVNTYDNYKDFTNIDYRYKSADVRPAGLTTATNADGITDEEFMALRPRSLADGAWTEGGGGDPGTEPGEGWLPDHIIINQAAGIGDYENDGSDIAIEYSFVELYNPTDAPVDISGWSLQYAESGAQWDLLSFPPSSRILPRSSYLVRINGPNEPGTRLFVPNADIQWENVTISNKAYKFALVGNKNELTVYNPAAAEGVVDLVGANNSADADWYEGDGPVAKMSKQQAVRRINFADYDENWYDFESADYRATGVAGQNIEAYRPRWSGDGEWGRDVIPPPPPPSLAGQITFSKPAGIYDGQFDLVMTPSNNNYTIRYTLDGSDPKPDSAAYSSPLPMKDRTSDPNVLLWNTGTTGPRNEMPTYNRNDIGELFKGTVVKARLFDSNGAPASKTYVNSYYVNDDIKALYGDIPIISMSTPADNLFKDETGIYVKGLNEMGPFNFDQKGSEWERSVYFEMFDPAVGEGWETGAVVSQGMGLRIHGGASRHFPQKSFRFYARSGAISTNMGSQEIIGGAGSVDYDIFQGSARDNGGAAITGGFKRFMLRAGGNDSGRAFMRDSITDKLMEPINTVESMGYRSAALFINGEFWGMYQVLERFDEEYLTQHFGGESGNYRILENPSPGKTLLEDNAEDTIAYFESKVALVNAIPDMNAPGAYAALLQIVDEDSLIDYVVMETLGGNTDWVSFEGEWDNEYGTFIYTGNNQRMWYYTGVNDGLPGHDGRFRWMIYDTDKMWGYPEGEANYASYNTIADALHDNLFFFNKLMQNDAFRSKFYNRYVAALNSWLSLDAMHSAANAIASEISTAMAEHRKRWPYSLSAGEWQSEVNAIKQWMADRVNPAGPFIAALNTYAVYGDDEIAGVEPVYGAAFVGEPGTLPSLVNVTYGGGGTGAVSVTWDTAPFVTAKAYDTVTLTGTVYGYSGIAAATIEVIPRNLAYFIDAGTARLYSDGNPLYPSTMRWGFDGDVIYDAGEDFVDSKAYGPVAAMAAGSGKPLRNQESDGLFNGAWGLMPDAYQFPAIHLDSDKGQKLATGYVGWDDRDEEWYWDKNKYIEYELYLPAGNYRVTTGHYCWWSLMYNEGETEPYGGFPRTMQVLFNGAPPAGSEQFTFNTLGDNRVDTYNYTQEESGLLSIKVLALDGGDGATLSFIGVEELSTVGGDAIAGVIGGPVVSLAAYVGEPDSLPAELGVRYVNGSVGVADVVWDTAPFAAARAYDCVILSGVVGGEFSAQAKVEVIPRNLMYYIDAGTAGLPGTWYMERIGDESYSSQEGYISGSEAYDLVAARLAADGAQPLRNAVSDQLYDGSPEGWGIVEGAYQFPVYQTNADAEIKKFATGYVGWDNWDDPDYYDKNKYIEYLVFLPKGEYMIGTGHYCWWSPTYDEETGDQNGGYPRTMEVLFNGVAPEGGAPFTFDTFGDRATYLYHYTQEEDGLLSIRSSMAADVSDGATLTFIGIQGVGASSECIRGDLNDDGVVNIVDLLMLRQYVGEYPVEVCKYGADVNGDGKIDIRDILALRILISE